MCLWRNWLYYGKLYYSSYFAVFNGHNPPFLTSQIRSPTQQLKPKELVPGNALVETGTFLAILLGTLGAGVIASAEGAEVYCCRWGRCFCFTGTWQAAQFPR